MIKSKKFDEYIKRIPDIFSYLSIIYVTIVLTVFPLIFHDYYFDILVFKFQFYYILTICFIFLILIQGMIFVIYDIYFYKGIKLKKIFSKKNKILSGPELSLLLFMFMAVVSTILSDYKFESFWGNEGRLTGCFILLLYGFSVLLIVKLLKFKKWIIYLFLFSGIIICFFGITDYFQLDILNFKEKMDPNQYNMFASTIGNVNTYTSYVALVVAISTVLFSKEKNFWKSIFYYFCMVTSFFAILMGLSDNSYLAIGALFGFLPLYLFRSKSGLKRYLLILTSFTGVIYGIDTINKMMPDRVLKMDGILQKISSFSKLEYIVIGMVGLSILVYAVDCFLKFKKEELGHKWQYVWLGFLVIVFALIIFSLIDVNVFNHTKRYGSFGSYLLFNDDWGTHRGYNWRIAIESYNKFSIIHKLFGYGPDTYGIITHFNYYNEMLDKYHELYDSVHNEYLQYFITMGPVSLISYLLFLITSGIRMIKRGKDNVYVVAIFFAVICYAVQAFVNISVPIVAPIMFTLLAIGLSVTRKENELIKPEKEIFINEGSRAV